MISKFEIKASDLAWFKKLNSKFWSCTYKGNKQWSGQTTFSEYLGLLVLIDRYDLPCSVGKDNHSNFKLVIYGHEPYIHVTPDPLLEIDRYSFRDLSDNKNLHMRYWDTEKKTMLKLLNRFAWFLSIAL